MCFCLFVCLLSALRKNYLTDFHKILWKGRGTLATENPLNFGGNPDHVIARIMVTVDVPRHTQAVLRFGKGRLMPHTTLGMLHPGFVS